MIRETEEFNKLLEDLDKIKKELNLPEEKVNSILEDDLLVYLLLLNQDYDFLKILILYLISINKEVEF